MNEKLGLTLRMDAELIAKAKEEATRRGKSVSQMVGDFFLTLRSADEKAAAYPPVTSSLLGLLKDTAVSEDDYKKHLEEKYF